MSIIKNYISIISIPLLETLYMTFVSTLIAIIIGFPLGYYLYKRKINYIYKFFDYSVNILRSFPFIILMVILFPLSRLIVGTTIGTTASIVPLAIAAIPFIARIVQNELSTIDHKLVLAIQTMGASELQLITKVLIPETLPSLINGLTLTIINLIGLTAMAGAIGGGGLGDLAIRYGYHRFETDILILSVIIIILFVQIIQYIGSKIEKSILSKR